MQSTFAYYINTFPQYTDIFEQLKSLFESKKWHQLTQSVIKFLQKPDIRGKQSHQLYTQFIKKFQTKIDHFKLAKILLFVSFSFSTTYQRIYFLDEGLKIIKGDHPLLLIKLIQGCLYIQVGDIYQSQTILNTARDKIIGKSGIPQSLYSAFYKLGFNFHRHKKDYSEFYTYALQYLAYPDWDRTHQQAMQLCYQMGSAVLVSDKIFNFSQLLQIPVLKSLENSQYNYIFQFLKTFNKGNVSQYNQLVKKFNQKISKNQHLNTQQKMLQQKIRLMSFMQLIFSRSKADRTVSFNQISKNCQINLQQVQYLVMRAMALGLVKGRINQVDNQVSVNWIMPRVLDKKSIQIMAQKYKVWTNQVKKLANQMQHIKQGKQ